MLSIDYLENLDSILPFENEVKELRKKYGYPISYMYQRDYMSGGRPGVSDVFYSEFTVLKEKIINWLMKEYSYETANLFRDDGTNMVMPWGIDYSSPQYKGLNAWIGSKTRPAPHGGYPGAQWAYETSNTGYVAKLVPALITAYGICKAHGDERRKREEELKEQERKEHERELLQTQEFVNSLINSLHMAPPPMDSITNTMVDSWQPRFSNTVYKDIAKRVGKYKTDRICNKAWKESSEKREQMISAFLESRRGEENEIKKSLLYSKREYDRKLLEIEKEKNELALQKQQYEQELLFLREARQQTVE